MIPEFPLPTVDADFYKSQICQLPPIFGHAVHTPQLIEPTTFLMKTDSLIVDSLRTTCLKNAVKQASIRHHNLTKTSKPLRSTVGSMNALSSLSSLMGSLVITQWFQQLFNILHILLDTCLLGTFPSNDQLVDSSYHHHHTLFVSNIYSFFFPHLFTHVVLTELVSPYFTRFQNFS